MQWRICAKSNGADIKGVDYGKRSKENKAEVDLIEKQHQSIIQTKGRHAAFLIVSIIKGTGQDRRYNEKRTKTDK